MLALCEYLGKLREKNQFSEGQNTKEQKNNVISLKNEDARFTKVSHCPFFDLAHCTYQLHFYGSFEIFWTFQRIVSLWWKYWKQIHCSNIIESIASVIFYYERLPCQLLYNSYTANMKEVLSRAKTPVKKILGYYYYYKSRETKFIALWGILLCHLLTYLHLMTE